MLGTPKSYKNWWAADFTCRKLIDLDPPSLRESQETDQEGRHGSGLLVCTREGHMSVQMMYRNPQAFSAPYLLRGMGGSRNGVTVAASLGEEKMV